MNELKIDINDLEYFKVKNLELDLSGEDHTGMLELNGFNGIVVISRAEIQDIRRTYEDDYNVLVTSILLVGSKIISTNKYGAEIDLQIIVDETRLNRGVIEEKINVDIEYCELN